MSNTTVLKILNELKKNQTIEVCGWVKTFRANRFIALNDGSCLENIQCVIDFENTDDNILKKITTGSSVKISGKIVESKGTKQTIEIQVNKIDILGESNPDQYPIQPKKHSFEFLRENAHLRARTSTFNAIMRLRSSLSFAIHKFFNDEGFYYVHTPIITGSDAEGAGEQFRVTTLNPKNPELNSKKMLILKKIFLGKKLN